MSRIIPSSFTKYKLTPEEELRGRILTEENKQVIQNHISDLAEERLNVRFDPLNPLAFAQREAELTGQIGILKMLIDNIPSTLEINFDPEGNN